MGETKPAAAAPESGEERCPRCGKAKFSAAHCGALHMAAPEPEEEYGPLDLDTIHPPQGPLIPICPPEHREQAAEIARLRAELQREREARSVAEESLSATLAQAKDESDRADAAEQRLQEVENCGEPDPVHGCDCRSCLRAAHERHYLRALAAEQRLRNVEADHAALLDLLTEAERLIDSARTLAVANGNAFSEAAFKAWLDKLAAAPVPLRGEKP